MEAPEDLSFNEKNMFGFPQRNWLDFADGETVLAAIGEAEVRARLKAREPSLLAEQEVLSAALCAHWLLQVEMDVFTIADIEHFRLQLQREEDEHQYRLQIEREAEEYREYEQEQLRREAEERAEAERRMLRNEEAWIEIYRARVTT
jgi:hypothetical protein